MSIISILLNLQARLFIFYFVYTILQSEIGECLGIFYMKKKGLSMFVDDI